MKPGSTVMHSNFGAGTVVNTAGSSTIVNFDSIGKETVQTTSLTQMINS